MNLATSSVFSFGRLRTDTSDTSSFAVNDAFETFELQECVDRTERARAERFIAERYMQAFEARIEAFMPRLLTLRAVGDCSAKIRGALGLRSAKGRLFVEQYFDAPVEQRILAATGERVERASIVEVGHFAGLGAGTMRVLILGLTARLQHEGAQWVVFAGTRALCNAFLRMNLRPIALCPALPERLPAHARAGWGRYYAHDPWVYAGRVEHGARALLSTTRVTKEPRA